jgi:spore coat protein JB
LDERRNDYQTGTLPARYPLATALTPMQRGVDPAYDSDQALMRGTLFPGLDLPFMNMVNKDLPSTPMTELMAIDFVTKELALYLDTHAEDGEAFELFQSFLALGREAQRRYVQLYGPVSAADMLGADSYTWLNAPWPWEYCARREG